MTRPVFSRTVSRLALFSMAPSVPTYSMQVGATTDYKDLWWISPNTPMTVFLTG
jgi:hypothetical protein